MTPSVSSSGYVLKTSIIDKIFAATIDNDNRITEADRQFCIETESRYKKLIGDLQQWHALLLDTFNTQYPGRLETYNDKHDEIRYRVKETKFTEKLLRYCPIEALEEVDSTKEKVQRWFVNHTLAYFNETYRLRMDSDDDTTGKLLQADNYKTILDWIILHLGGISFTEKCRDYIISDMRSLLGEQLRYSVSNLRLTLEFNSSKLFEYNNGGYEFDNMDKNFLAFQHALGFFETSDISFSPKSSMTHGENVLFNHNYDFFDTQKISCIKFFKKGKVVITFCNRNDVDAFIRCFDLETVCIT